VSKTAMAESSLACSLLPHLLEGSIFHTGTENVARGMEDRQRLDREFVAR